MFTVLHNTKFLLNPNKAGCMGSEKKPLQWAYSYNIIFPISYAVNWTLMIVVMENKDATSEHRQLSTMLKCLDFVNSEDSSYSFTDKRQHLVNHSLKSVYTWYHLHWEVHCISTLCSIRQWQCLAYEMGTCCCAGPLTEICCGKFFIIYI